MEWSASERLYISTLSLEPLLCTVEARMVTVPLWRLGWCCAAVEARMIEDAYRKWEM